MKRKLASLDDEPESETQFQSLIVSNYHLVDSDDELVSFSVLPIQWSDSEVSNVDDGNKQHIFIQGSVDNGLQKIFMQVTAWKFDISGFKPKVSLLSQDGRWIELVRPRKSFQDTVKTVLITLYFLHCVKKKPRLSATSFWSNLCKDRDLSSYGFKPSQKDLLDHMSLIGEATKRDSVLARSKLLLTVLGDKPEDQKQSDEEFEDLAQSGDDEIINEADEDSYLADNLFDSVCALCDNGGNLVCCEGPCMRSFHGTKADGRGSFCDSLGFTKKEVDDIDKFYCKNCEYRQHQCFACGKLGSSDKDKGAEVIKCGSETCDRFYHPDCVVKLLPRLVKDAAEDFEKHIVDGKSFICPLHFCCVCKGLENKIKPELQFAVCQRCPKAYHRKCLPTGINFEDIDGNEIRAWKGLLPNNRILIYCLNHEINDKLGTPIRDHIKLPNTGAAVLEINTSNKRMKPTTKERVILKNDVGCVKLSGKSTAKGSEVTGNLPSSNIGSKKSSKKITPSSGISRTPESKEMSSTCLTENKKSISKNSSEKVNSFSDISRKAKSDKLSCWIKNKKAISNLSEKMISGSHISKKPTSNEISKQGQVENNKLTENKKSISNKLEMAKCEENKPTSGQKSCATLSKGSEQINHCNQVDDADNKTLSIKPIRSVLPSLDADSENGLVGTFKETRSSISLKFEKEKHKLGDVEDKAITMGKDTAKQKLTPNHDLLEPTDDEEKQASVSESQKRSSHDGNVDQESQKRQEFKMGKSWKTSGKRKRVKKNARRGLGVPSTSFKENGAVSQAKRRLVKGGPSNQERSHSETEKGPKVASPVSACAVKNADENHRARQQVVLGVRSPNSMQNDHLSGRDTSCANKHAQLGPATESLNKMNTPDADELNVVRTGSLTPPGTPLFSGNGTSERSVPPGFAAGLNYAFSLHHSAGWLDE